MIAHSEKVEWEAIKLDGKHDIIISTSFTDQNRETHLHTCTCYTHKQSLTTYMSSEQARLLGASSLCPDLSSLHRIVAGTPA